MALKENGSLVPHPGDMAPSSLAPRQVEDLGANLSALACYPHTLVGIGCADAALSAAGHAFAGVLTAACPLLEQAAAAPLANHNLVDARLETSFPESAAEAMRTG
jgi:hypothetical protein